METQSEHSLSASSTDNASNSIGGVSEVAGGSGRGPSSQLARRVRVLVTRFANARQLEFIASAFVNQMYYDWIMMFVSF